MTAPQSALPRKNRCAEASARALYDAYAAALLLPLPFDRLSNEERSAWFDVREAVKGILVECDSCGKELVCLACESNEVRCECGIRLCCPDCDGEDYDEPECECGEQLICPKCKEMIIDTPN
jgi:hypothetical protein